MIVKSVLSFSETVTNRDLLKEKGKLCQCGHYETLFNQTPE